MRTAAGKCLYGTALWKYLSVEAVRKYPCVHGRRDTPAAVRAARVLSPGAAP